MDQLQLSSQADHIAAQIVVVLNLVQNDPFLGRGKYCLVLFLSTLKFLPIFLLVVCRAEGAIGSNQPASKFVLSNGPAIEVQPRCDGLLFPLQYL